MLKMKKIVMSLIVILLLGSVSIWCADPNIDVGFRESRQNALVRRPGVLPPAQSRLRRSVGRCCETCCESLEDDERYMERFNQACKIGCCVGFFAGVPFGAIKSDMIARLLGLQND